MASGITPEIHAAICEAIAASESLRAACRAVDVDHSYYLAVVARDATMEAEYARAMEIRATAGFAELDALSDTTPERDPETGRLDPASVQHLRLRIDTRKWTLARMAPKKYGDKVTQEHTGADGEPLLANLTVTYRKPDDDKP